MTAQLDALQITMETRLMKPHGDAMIYLLRWSAIPVLSCSSCTDNFGLPNWLLRNGSVCRYRRAGTYHVNCFVQKFEFPIDRRPAR